MKKSKRIAWLAVVSVAGYTHGSRWLISAIITCAKIARQNNDKQQKRDKITERQITMRITKEQGIKIKKAIQDRGYSITGFCRIHNISDRQFYAWLAGTNGYERNGIGKHFQEITDALLADKTLDVASQRIKS
jgi:transposase-like protein